MTRPVSPALEDDLDLISRSPASGPQKKVAAGLLLTVTGIVLIAFAFGSAPIAGTEALLPAYATWILVVEVLTAVLLMTLYFLEPCTALLMLAVGYFFTGLMVVPWVLTFPGIFDALSLDSGLQTTAVIAALRRIGFPLFVLAYAIFKNQRAVPNPNGRSSVLVVLIGFAAVCATVAAISFLVLSNQSLLPNFMRSTSEVATVWAYVPATAIAISCLDLVLLSRRTSTLDLWLVVAIGSTIFETILLSYVGGGVRLSVVWWVGRSCGLFSASILLVFMIFETMGLYARLVRAIASERRLREARLTEMEAMTASIIHELAQPLASITMNADAARNWLAKKTPNLAETSASLDRIAADGRRTSEVVHGLRAAFKKVPQMTAPLDVKRAVAVVLGRLKPEAARARVTIDTDHQPGPLIVLGNQVQLEQVLTNIMLNAIEAMTATVDRPRVLSVKCGALGARQVYISVSDTGPGISREHQDRIFDPFFSTKPDGLGIGLMLSRSMIESQGGRLELGVNGPDGVTIEMTLKKPDAGDPPPQGSRYGEASAASV
ncbi:MAG: ATP-binding protein [Cypionkella sp.]